MQGGGTELNPYLIETWSDFEEVEKIPATADQAKRIYSRLVQDLDGNDYNGGIFKSMNAPVNLDGGGHTIRNLYLYSDTSAGTDDGLFRVRWYAAYNWRNVNLENIMSNFCVFGTYDSTYRYYLKNCTINGAAKALAKSKIECEECTISLDSTTGLASACNAALKPTLRRCSAKVRVSAPTADTLNFDSYTSRVEMELNKPTELTLDTSKVLTCTNSVLAIKLEEGDTTEWRIAGNENGVSVLDKSLWGEGVKAGITAGVVELSTMDMKNADALNAAGFAVVRVT